MATYVCSKCGNVSSFKLGKCQNCGSIGTIEKQVETEKQRKEKINNSYEELGNILKPKRVEDFKNITDNKEFIKLHNEDVLRAFQNGIMKGGLYLLSGEPGVGKSTLILQLIDDIQKQGIKCGYFSGEETELQIAKRAERLGVECCDLFNTGNLEDIIRTIDYYDYEFVIIDSIQTTYTNTNLNLTGGVSQIKAVGDMIVQIFKKKGITAIIVGHINKDGDVAGPKYLEHMVDCSVQLEGEKGGMYRFLRAKKNRYGSTDDVGIFEMTPKGLVGVTDYQKRVSEKYTGKPGNILSMGMYNGRPILVNIEVLLTNNSFNFPQRQVIGYSKDRLNLVISILEKYLKIDFSKFDIFLNIPGEISFKNDVGIDLGVALALYSSLLNRTYGNKIFIGELTLMGQVQECSFYKKRKNEGKGFEIISQENLKEIKEILKIK